MTTVYDVPAGKFIANLAERIKPDAKLAPPEWVPFVKTGVHVEKAPDNPDWWFPRVASILRKVYMMGPIGSERLSQLYGGFRDRGSKPNRAEGGSSSISRKALQALENAGLVQNIKGRGRVVTAKGRQLCDGSAHAVAKELEKTIPALAKY